LDHIFRLFPATGRIRNLLLKKMKSESHVILCFQELRLEEKAHPRLTIKS